MTYEEQAAEEAKAFEHFHSLRKYNSTRKERQDAYYVTFMITQRRHIRFATQRPISPQWQWQDLDRTAPKNWTYPGCRSLERAEVQKYFPGALESFDINCTDLQDTRFVVSGSLKLSRPMGLRLAGNVVWHPDARVWRRFTCGVKSHPRRILLPYE